MRRAIDQKGAGRQVNAGAARSTQAACSALRRLRSMPGKWAGFPPRRGLQPVLLPPPGCRYSGRPLRRLFNPDPTSTELPRSSGDGDRLEPHAAVRGMRRPPLVRSGGTKTPTRWAGFEGEDSGGWSQTSPAHTCPATMPDRHWATSSSTLNVRRTRIDHRMKPCDPRFREKTCPRQAICEPWLELPPMPT